MALGVSPTHLYFEVNRDNLVLPSCVINVHGFGILLYSFSHYVYIDLGRLKNPCCIHESILIKMKDWINKWRRIDKVPVQKNSRQCMYMFHFEWRRAWLPLVKCGLPMMISFQRGQKGRWESRFTAEKPDDTTTARCSRWTSTVIGHIDDLYPRYDVIIMALYICDLPPQSP